MENENPRIRARLCVNSEHFMLRTCSWWETKNRWRGHQGSSSQSPTRNEIQDVNSTQKSGTGPLTFRAASLGVAAAAIYMLQIVFASEAFCMSYSVKGTLTYEGHGLGELPGQVATPFVREFEVLLEDANWTVRMVPVGDANFSYFLSTYDGTNIMYVDGIRPDVQGRLLAAAQTQPNGKSVNSILPSGLLESSAVPRAMSSTGGAYAWLAFASGAYFKASTNGMAVDLYALETRSGLFTARRDVPCSFELSSVAPYLPVRVEYRWPNLAYMKADGVIVGRALPSPFQAGFVAAQFTSEAFTNIGGLSFPSKFEMKEYRPLPSATNASDYRCTLSVRGAVTAISVNPRHGASGLSGVELHVTDLRYPNAPMYTISNGAIPTPADPRIKAATAEALRRLRATTVHDGEKAGNARFFWVSLCGIAFISPLFFIIYRSTKTNTHQQ
jgi:hypothetical protein